MEIVSHRAEDGKIELPKYTENIKKILFITLLLSSSMYIDDKTTMSKTKYHLLINGFIKSEYLPPTVLFDSISRIYLFTKVYN